MYALYNVKTKKFYVRENEFVTLLGPSGCGKTTTLRIIGGFVEPESGEVIFDDKRINGTPPHKRNVNTVFQKYSLFPHLNVFDNVAFGLKLKKLPKKEIKEKQDNSVFLVEVNVERLVNLENGGYGPCGRKMCCCAFLTEFDSVSINMAKNQNIALNPNKEDELKY